MDMQDWIKIGIMSSHRWPGVNAETAVQRCERNSFMIPIFNSALEFDFSVYPFGRPPSEPIKQEEVVLDALRLGSGHEIHIGYSKRTNSLWINEG